MTSSRQANPIGSTRPRLLLGLLCGSQFLNIVNISSVNIALPDIAADLGFSESTLPWVVSAYLLTFAGFLLVGGRVADRVGRRRILLCGLAGFGVCTLAAALATNPTMLITARALQGVGAAMTIPASLGILTRSFTAAAARSRAVAAFGAAGAVGFASGLVLGGAVTAPMGWRWVFGLTLPAVAGLVLLVMLVVPRDPVGEHSRGSIDLVSAAAATTGLLGLVFGLTNGGRANWTDPATVGPLVAGIGLLGAFVHLQTRIRRPLMPLRLWRRPNFAAAMLLGFCLFGAWVGGIYFLTLTLQRVLGYTPTEAAAALLPLAVMGLIGATAAGRLLPSIGAKPLLVVGFGLSITSFVLMALLHADSAYWPQILAAVVLAVGGNSISYVASSVIALADARPDEESLVGGLFNTGMQVGGGFGLAVMSAVAATRIGADTAGSSLLPAYRSAFWTAAAFLTVGLAIAIRFVRTPSRAGEPG